VADISQHLLDKVRAAAISRAPSTRSQAPAEPEPLVGKSMLRTTHKIVAIGASTGGTEALKTVMRQMPGDSPAVLIVQHMPERFTTTFAGHLNEISPMQVREAKHGDLLVPGLALLAPGNYHMVVNRSGARYSVQVKSGPPVHHQRPAVDVLFHSVARHVGPNAVGAILTGMGADGAKGMLAMRQAGAHTVAQDEKSCVVFGMPKEAIACGAAEKVCPLNQIPRQIVNFLAAEGVAMRR
jgi:two-component system chemotaxis response regulator CheB